MPSKYNDKHKKQTYPKIKKQEPSMGSHFQPREVNPCCTNCGRVGWSGFTHSKCGCGGTMQTYSR